MEWVGEGRLEERGLLALNLNYLNMSKTEEEWVNGELHSLIGMSDDMTVSYVLSLAKQMKDSAKIYQGLVDFDFP